MNTYSQPTTRFSITTPMVLFGLVMFLLNRVMDENFNLPIGELVLPALTVYLLAKSGRLSKLFQSPGIILFAGLLVWMTLSNMVNGISFGGQFRNTFAVTTLFLPVLAFAALKDREAVMGYILGNIMGFSLYFAFYTALAFPEFPRTLRAIQITPAVPIALYFLLRSRLSKPAAGLLLASAALTLLVSIMIDARGPILSVIIGIGLFLLAKASPWPRLALSVSVMASLTAHFIASFFTASNFDVVANSTSDTVSNLERAYAIDYVRMVLDQAPWFGASPQSYSVNFSDFFMAISKLQIGDNIASPHNSFLEYSVFFGYPAGFLLILLVGRMVYAASAGSVARSLCAAFACAGIIRLGAFYGFSGWLRVEWFSMIIAMYYLCPPIGEKAPEITPEGPAAPAANPALAKKNPR